LLRTEPGLAGISSASVSPTIDLTKSDNGRDDIIDITQSVAPLKFVDLIEDKEVANKVNHFNPILINCDSFFTDYDIRKQYEDTAEVNVTKLPEFEFNEIDDEDERARHMAQYNKAI
jgi:hypothetical protein